MENCAGKIAQANFSFPFGFPLTSGLLPPTLEVLEQGTLFHETGELNINKCQEEQEDLPFLFRALCKLLPGWKKGVSQGQAALDYGDSEA
jgi:hypothetical protein